MTTLTELDTNLFRWINGHHGVATDWIMWIFTQHWSQAIVIALVFGWIVWKTRGQRWWLLLIGIGLCFLVSDQLSNIIKDIVQQPRPCHALSDVVMFKTRCGGAYGFVSSHASNCFTIVLFLSLVARRYNKHTLLPYIMTLWAIVVCYSRPYLGKHYPGDVICGALLGIVLGLLIGWLYHKVSLLLDRRKA